MKQARDFQPDESRLPLLVQCECGRDVVVTLETSVDFAGVFHCERCALTILEHISYLRLARPELVDQ